MPYCPPAGTGFIWRTWDFDQHVYIYQWYWLNTPKHDPDPNMRIKVTLGMVVAAPCLTSGAGQVWYEPNVDGDYTSPAASALRQWGMAKIATRSASRAVFHGSHLPTFLVHQPPRYKSGEEKIEMEFADAEEMRMQRDAVGHGLEVQQITRSAAQSAVAEAQAMNRGLVPGLLSTNPVLNSESIRVRSPLSAHTRPHMCRIAKTARATACWIASCGWMTIAHPWLPRRPCCWWIRSNTTSTWSASAPCWWTSPSPWC